MGNSSSDDVKEKILNQIDSAFSDVPYPDSGDFFTAIADRDYEEREDLKNKKKCSQVTKQDLEKYYDFLCFLNSDGVIYYLPSYMKLIIENWELAEHWCTDCILTVISDINIDLLTACQRDSIRVFLNYCWNAIYPEVEFDEVLIKKAINHIVNE